MPAEKSIPMARLRRSRGRGRDRRCRTRRRARARPSRYAMTARRRAASRYPCRTSACGSRGRSGPRRGRTSARRRAPCLRRGAAPRSCRPPFEPASGFRGDRGDLVVAADLARGAPVRPRAGLAGSGGRRASSPSATATGTRQRGGQPSRRRGVRHSRSGWRTCSSKSATAASAMSRVALVCSRASASNSGSGNPRSSSESPWRTIATSASV